MIYIWKGRILKHMSTLKATSILSKIQETRKPLHLHASQCYSSVTLFQNIFMQYIQQSDLPKQSTIRPLVVVVYCNDPHKVHHGYVMKRKRNKLNTSSAELTCRRDAGKIFGEMSETSITQEQYYIWCVHFLVIILEGCTSLTRCTLYSLNLLEFSSMLPIFNGNNICIN